jgi:2-polyprenyl-6-methoxyphenol hydroxylase-like FAD-dependent oxidoreductase
VADIEVPVLIAGGSLVGLSSALLLGHYGIRTLAVEHHRGTAIHPRAAQISQRTMEIFRTVGIEQIVRQKSGEQFVQDGAVMAVETLAGKEIAYYIANLNEGIRDVSPTERVFISQSLLEPLLKMRAEELGAELRFGTDMVSFEQDADGVTAVICERGTGKSSTVHARYLIAADGSHSRVRRQFGIRMHGHGSFSKSVTIYFHANVAPLLRDRNLSVIYVLNPTLRGFFRFEKPFDSGFLAINAVGDPAHPVTDVSTGLTDERCRELIRAALGADGVPITVDNVMHWEAEAGVAESFRQGRVFLAGDAAHVMPPNGGFGGNTGVQDAQNLAWKLALVLKGAAGRELLATYEQERRPASAFTVEQAYTRYVTRTAPYLGNDGVQPAENDLNVELGYCYHSSAVIPEDAGDTRVHENPRESQGRPGTRAPHVFVPPGGSSLDWFGRNFVLLTGPACPVEVPKDAGVQVDIHALNSATLEAFGIAADGAVLVRPDGFVGWRARNAQDAPALGAALSAILSR